MKKLTLFIAWIFLTNIAFGQGYQSQLDELNEYLMKFDNNKYHGFNLINETLYNLLENENYSRAKIKEIDKAEIDLAQNKVILKCKSDNCVNYKLTDGNDSSFSFNSSTGKDIYKLRDLINNFLAAYRNEPIIKKEKIDNYLDVFIDDLFNFDDSDLLNPNNTTTSSKSTTTSTNNKPINDNYENALDKINTYLKTFDNGYYGYLKIEGEYLVENFKSGKYCKAKISSIDKAVEDSPNSKVIIKCKSGEDCVFSTHTDSYHSRFSFSQSDEFNTSELITLINNFLNAYKSK